MPSFRRHLVQLAGLALLHEATCGFVLLSSHEGKLPVSPTAPTQNFVWDGKAPTSIQDKDKYKNGIYQDLDDASMMKQLLDDAMGLWNNVPGSFVKLEVAEGTATDDHADGINSILVLHDSNLSSAALAQPTYDPDNQNDIYDCDIHINNTAVAAEDLAFIIAHELGHCLGLGHAHTNYGAIMGYSRADHSLSLGLDDKAGVVYLYPDPNVWDGKVKELVCGTIGGRAATSGQGLALILLAVPALGAVFSARRRRG